MTRSVNGGAARGADVIAINSGAKVSRPDRVHAARNRASGCTIFYQAMP
jgi:hypothetical protein